MPEMIKCQHCGAFVPAEKAFCPNCSEPMEVEEKPNRAHSFSPEMLATIRDDPEKWRQLLVPPVKKQPEAAEPPQMPVNNPMPPPQPSAPPIAGYNYPNAAPYTLPPKKSSNLALILGISAAFIVIALLIIFLVFKPF